MSDQMTEQQMRAATVPTHETLEGLSAYIASMAEREHDYGTCVYAMSMAATAAFNYVAGRLGVTGFQASCADLDIIRRTRRIERPFALIDSNKMLYPQYSITRDVQELLRDWGPWAGKQARAMLAESTPESVSPRVIAHWRKLSSEHPEEQEASDE